MIRPEQIRAAQERYRRMAQLLNEQSRGRFVASEAQSLGHGGVIAMARISGMARSTINRGLLEIQNKIVAPEGRVRNPGGGRKRKTSEYPTLMSDLKKLVSPTTRGDPVRPLCGRAGVCANSQRR